MLYFKKKCLGRLLWFVSTLLIIEGKSVLASSASNPSVRGQNQLYLLSDDDYMNGVLIDLPVSHSHFLSSVGYTGIDLNKVVFYGPSQTPPYSIKDLYKKIDSIYGRISEESKKKIANASSQDEQNRLSKLSYERFKNSSIKYMDKVINRIYSFIQKSKVDKPSNSPRKYYSGLNGELNGSGFDFEKDNLPTKIAWASYCFGIDPFMFTSLIKHESKFSSRALSHTKAMGLTQLTAMGFTEVNEQLGLLGSGFHSPKAPAILGKQIQCYLAGEKVWMPFWKDQNFLRSQNIKVIDKNSQIEFGKQFYIYKNKNFGKTKRWKYVSLFKKWLEEDPDRQIIYGAILFKIFLYDGNYYRALKRYNGEGAQNEERYAQNVANEYKSLRKVKYESAEEMRNIKQNLETPMASYLAYQKNGLNCLIESDFLNNYQSYIDDYLSMQEVELSGLSMNLEDKAFNSMEQIELIKERIVLNESQCRPYQIEL